MLLLVVYACLYVCLQVSALCLCVCMYPCSIVKAKQIIGLPCYLLTQCVGGCFSFFKEQLASTRASVVNDAFCFRVSGVHPKLLRTPQIWALQEIHLGKCFYYLFYKCSG